MYFYLVLLEGGGVVDLVSCWLAQSVFLALVLTIGAFLACTLGAAVSTAFLSVTYKQVFCADNGGTGAALISKLISLSSSTLLGVALHLHFNCFSLCLAGLSSTSSAFNLVSVVAKMFSWKVLPKPLCWTAQQPH